MSDKPAHILEIPDSLGRDVDKARAGKLKGDLPVEAFLSADALAHQEALTREAMAPVHAEQLVPITKAEAARRTTFDGEHLPKVPATRRVIPPPFRRPRFDLDRHGRSWQSCPVEKVRQGDVVPDIGLVARDPDYDVRYETVAGVPDVAVGMKVVITGVSGTQARFEPGSYVQAFRLAELWQFVRSAACAQATAALTTWSARSLAGKSPGLQTRIRMLPLS